VVFTGKDALLTQSLRRELEELREHIEIVSMKSELIYSDLLQKNFLWLIITVSQK
jgi:hypothetical protein